MIFESNRFSVKATSPCPLMQRVDIGLEVTPSLNGSITVAMARRAAAKDGYTLVIGTEISKWAKVVKTSGARVD